MANMEHALNQFLFWRYVDADTLEYLYCNKQAEILSGPKQISITKLASKQKLAAGSTNILLVPSMDVVLTDINLPNLNERQKHSAAAFALEDKILDDIEDMHFVVKHSHENPCPVALVKRAKMQEWLTPFQEQQIDLQVMLPEVLALPYQADSWQLFVDDKQVLVRTGQDSGVSVLPENLAEFLHWKFALLAEESPASLHVVNNADSTLQEDLEDSFLNLDISAESHDDSHLIRLMPEALRAHEFNLLQGEFAPPKKQNTEIKLFYMAGGLLAIAVLSLLFSNIFAYFDLQNANQKLKQQISVVYREIFPQASTVIAPRQRVQQLLKNSNNKAYEQSFLKLFYPFAKVLNRNRHVKLQQISYHNKRLQLAISTTGLAPFRQFQRQLHKVMPYAKATKVQSKGNHLQAIFDIKELN